MTERRNFVEETFFTEYFLIFKFTLLYYIFSLISYELHSPSSWSHDLCVEFFNLIILIQYITWISYR